ncbi:MAG: sporulation integral membrane protein YtvI [Clostridiales bacterium]|jgi:sporulation integral membrane protein YtvI|nr:sporulation integral membrane protein YtvI [Clostridiales bacterium]
MKVRGLNTKNTLVFCAAMFAVLLCGFLFAKAARLISPLIVAFIISTALEPLIKQLIRRIRLKRAFAAPAVIILLLAVVFLLLWALILKLIKEYNAFAGNLPGIVQSFYKNVQELLERAKVTENWLPFRIEFAIDFDALYARLYAWATNYAQTVAESLVKNAVTTAAGLPHAIVFVVSLMLSTYFLLTEREEYISYFRRNLPQKWLDGLAAFRVNALSAVLGYLRAQLIIMGVLVVPLFVGLMVLGVRYALVLAFLVALLDALPVFGSSMVLLPWALWSLLIGDYFTGVGLIVLFLVCSGLRRVIEPKILSRSIGVNVLVTITAMYAGLRLIGVTGLILGPITYLLLRSIIVGITGGRTFKEYFLVEDEL